MNYGYYGSGWFSKGLKEGSFYNPDYSLINGHAIDGPIRKGPRPVEEPPYIPFNQPLPEGCADWSGVCKDSNVYNTIDGSKCPMSESTKSSMTHTTYMCPEWKTSTLDRLTDSLKKKSPWRLMAVGAGAALFLTGYWRRK
jgi:hypothetical protein